MRSTIDSAGRLVIPKDVRREAGLRSGMPVEVIARNGRVEIEPAPLPVRLVQKGRLLVAVPRRRVPPMTAETVERTRQRLRGEPGGGRAGVHARYEPRCGRRRRRAATPP